MSVEADRVLSYFIPGDEVVLIASRGGGHRHPAWYHNVRANPEVELWTRGGGRHRARVCSPGD